MNFRIVRRKQAAFMYMYKKKTLKAWLWGFSGLKDIVLKFFYLLVYDDGWTDSSMMKVTYDGKTSQLTSPEAVVYFPRLPLTRPGT